MPHEGMVDALRRAIELLPPDGLLIDLHPTPDVAQLSLVQTDGTTELLGPLRSDTAVQRHTNADAAVAAAVAAHFLDRDSSAAFVFSRYCDSLDELVEHIERKWTAWFDEATLARARRALRPDSKLRLSEWVSISALRPRSPNR